MANRDTLACRWACEVGGQRAELARGEAVLPLILTHCRVLHRREVSLHHKVVAIAEIVVVIIFVVRIGAKGEHVVVARQRHASRQHLGGVNMTRHGKRRGLSKRSRWVGSRDLAEDVVIVRAEDVLRLHAGDRRRLLASKTAHMSVVSQINVARGAKEDWFVLGDGLWSGDARVVRRLRWRAVVVGHDGVVEHVGVWPVGHHGRADWREVEV